MVCSNAGAITIECRQMSEIFWQMILSDSYILFVDFDLSSVICSPIFNLSSYISFDFTSLISYFVWAWSNTFLLISHWRIFCWFITNRHTHLYVITLIFTEYLHRNFMPSAHFTNFSASVLNIHLFYFEIKYL